MIYDNLTTKGYEVKQEEVADVPQILEDVVRYEQFFPVERGDIVVDIGAHIGEFAKLHVKKAKKVYAVEPDTLFYNKFAKQKIAKLVPIHKAIGGFDGKTKIKSDGNANTIGSEEGITVNVVTFKTFLEQNKITKIDFLKIDCEGQEYNILIGSLHWIKENVRKVAGEFHIHNEDHKKLVPYVIYIMEQLGIKPIFTSVDGVILSKEKLLKGLDFYTEVLFYFRTDQEIEVEEPKVAQGEPTINYNFVNGCFVELLNLPKAEYTVKFINKDTDQVLHTAVIGTNNWTKCFYQYYINWQIVILENGKPFRVIDQSLKDLRVYIAVDSKSLGDTLAWTPYADVFRKTHNCTVVVSTFNNDLFKANYPEVEFVEPGTVVSNIMAQYNIGWFYNEDGTINIHRNPNDPKLLPLQQTATDILGLPFKELKPKLTVPKRKKKVNKVAFGIHSTAQAKYWNNPTGWKEVAEYLQTEGYESVNLSREGREYMGNKVPDNIICAKPTDLQSLINKLVTYKAYVGIGSGLSWLAWACGVPVVLVSGFSEPYTEMQPAADVIRVGTPTGKRLNTGCFNHYKLDANDWNWYEPAQLKGTERQFECSKLITSEPVIAGLKKLLKITN